MLSGFSINPGLLKGNLKRFWPLWLIYFAVLALLFVVPLWSGVVSMIDWQDDAVALLEDLDHAWAAAYAEAVPFAATASLIVAVSMNGYLFDASEATFMGASPVRRTALFATNYLSGLLGLVVVPAVCALVLCGLVVRVPDLGFARLAQWYALIVALTFVFYSIAQLCCQLTGTRPVAVVLYCVVNVLASCVETAVLLITSGLLYGVSGWDLPIDWASPLIGVIRYGLAGIPLSSTLSWGAIGAYVAAAAFVTFGAGWLSTRRRLESAGDAVAYGGMRVFLKYLAGVSTALMFGAATYLYFWAGLHGQSSIGPERVAALFAMMAVGGFLGLLFAEMIMRRSSRVFGRCWKGGLVLACASLAFVGGCYVDVLGIQSRVPAADAVASVEMRLGGDDLGKLSSSEAAEGVTDLHRELLALRDVDVDSVYWSDLDITYQLKNGEVLSRSYPVRVGQLESPDKSVYPDTMSRGYTAFRHLAEIVNTDEGRRARYADILDVSNDDVEFTVEAYGAEGDGEDYFSVPRGSKALFIEQALSPDLLDGPAGDFDPYLWVVNTSDTETSSLLLATSKKDGETKLELWLDTDKTPNTLAWFKEHYPDSKPEYWQVRPAEG